MARITTLPLWRMTSRSLGLPPGSRSLSWSTRNSEPWYTTSELSSTAVSTTPDLAALASFFALGLPAFDLRLVVFAAFAFPAEVILGFAAAFFGFFLGAAS